MTIKIATAMTPTGILSAEFESCCLASNVTGHDPPLMLFLGFTNIRNMIQ